MLSVREPMAEPVMLAGGQYYMAGNSNNGSGTAANIVAATGVQMATPDQPYGAPLVQVGNFSITQVNDPSTDMPYAADKAGKDSNFASADHFQQHLLSRHTRGAAATASTRFIR